MLETIILFFAILLAFISLLHLVNTWIEISINKEDGNTVPALFTGTISIILFCIFYYLTH